MRVDLLILGTLLLAAVAALVLWRPALMLALALLGLAINVWRMKKPARRGGHRPARKAPPAAAPVAERGVTGPEPPAVEALAAPANDTFNLSESLRAAGWSVLPARRGEPWTVAVHGDVRVALRTRTITPHADEADIADAMAAKDAEGAQYAAILTGLRPSDAVVDQAKAARVHIVAPDRLEAYLALALSFKSPPSPPQQAHG
ncbi:MAG: hypothetical protein NW200_09500 [Hyphomonadaceae bacterium]|nr:hypothetical protein [Hyphomonadaceae bacterium]